MPAALIRPEEAAGQLARSGIRNLVKPDFIIASDSTGSRTFVTILLKVSEQNVAQSWLAYDLTGSPFLLGLVGAQQFVPALFFSLSAGVIIDRFSKKKILLLTQAASFIIALARVSGPAVAGVLLGQAGMAACFFLNAASFAVVFLSLLFVHPLPVTQEKPVREGDLSTIGDGLRYIRGNKTLLETFLAIAIVGLFAPNFGVTVPVFAREILGLSESGFGFLMSALGVGSLAGALTIASLSRQGPNRQILLWGPVGTALLILLTGATRHPAGTAAGLALTGLACILFITSGNSTLQLTTLDAYRGRVMSVYSLVLNGTTPLGNLYAGFFAGQFGARSGFYACGLAILLLIGVRFLIFDGKSTKNSRMGV